MTEEQKELLKTWREYLYNKDIVLKDPVICGLILIIDSLESQLKAADEMIFKLYDQTADSPAMSYDLLVEVEKYLLERGLIKESEFSRG